MTVRRKNSVPLTKAHAIELIYTCLREANSLRSSVRQVQLSPDADLSVLDSLDLSEMVFRLEELLRDAFRQDVQLLDDFAAATQAQPFKSVDAMAEYMVAKFSGRAARAAVKSA